MEIGHILAFCTLFLADTLLLIYLFSTLPLRHGTKALLIAIVTVLAVITYSVTTEYDFLFKLHSHVATILFRIVCLVSLNLLSEINMRTNLLVKIVYYLSIALLIILFSILNIVYTQWVLLDWSDTYVKNIYYSSLWDHISYVILISMCIYACCIRLFI
jgi:hypothetical protein